MTGHSPAARSLTSYGLAAATLPPPSQALDERAWRRLMDEVGHQRLSGLLAWAIGDRCLPTTDEQLAEAVDAHHDACVLAVLLERELLEATARLRHVGLAPVVLKGPAVAHTAYPDPAIRPFADVDLLLPAEQMDTAVAVLTAAGGIRRYPEPRPGYDRRFGKGVSLRMPSGAELDLHRTLAPGYFGFRVDLPHLFATTTTLDLAGCRLRVLGPTERLLHACLHAVLGDREPRLLALRDVAQLVSAGAALPVVHQARAWCIESVVAEAITTSWQILGLRPDAGGDIVAWAHSYRCGRRQRRHLDRYHGPQRSSASLSIGALGAVPGWTGKLAYGLDLAFPRRSVRPPLERWRRGVRSLLAHPRP